MMPTRTLIWRLTPSCPGLCAIPSSFRLIPPMVVMSLLMMSFNLVADGLREALDPKMKSM